MTRRQESVLWLTVCFDTVFYAVLVPLLPHYVQRAHLSGLTAGVLVGAFGAGTMLGAFPGAVIARRRDAQAAAIAGLLTAATASIAFGFATSATALCAARLVQGIGSGIIWTGALAWLVTAADEDRRAATIGRALGAAVAGQLIGPLCGALGDLYGTTVLFTGIASSGVVLAVALARMPAPPPDEVAAEPVLQRVWRSLGQKTMLGAVWLVSLPALLSGTLAVIAPLRLSALGLSAVAIAAAWFVAAALECALNPLIGQWADRHGRSAPLRGALAASLGCSLALPWITVGWALAVTVCLTAMAYGALWVPAMTNLSDQAYRVGLGQGAGFALQSLWAPAHVFGSVVMGGAIAHWIGRTTVFMVLAGTCLATLAALAVAHMPSPATEVSRP